MAACLVGGATCASSGRWGSSEGSSAGSRWSGGPRGCSTVAVSVGSTSSPRQGRSCGVGSLLRVVGLGQRLTRPHTPITPAVNDHEPGDGRRGRLDHDQRGVAGHRVLIHHVPALRQRLRAASVPRHRSVPAGNREVNQLHRAAGRHEGRRRSRGRPGTGTPHWNTHAFATTNAAQVTTQQPSRPLHTPTTRSTWAPGAASSPSPRSEPRGLGAEASAIAEVGACVRDRQRRARATLKRRDVDVVAVPPPLATARPDARFLTSALGGRTGAPAA